MLKRGTMKTIPTWLIVSIGLLFNVSAALLTHFYIESENQQLAELDMQMLNNRNEMNLLWTQIEAVEQKRDTLLLMHQQGGVSKEMAEVVSQLIYAHLQQKLTFIELNDVQLINRKINQYQQNIRDQIDHLYLANLELTELGSEYNQSISGWRNLSIFLQLIGLSLILARDLGAK